MTSETPVQTHARRLREQGYCSIHDALPASILAMIDAELAPRFAHAPFHQGRGDGATTKRSGRLLVRPNHTQALALHSLVLRIVESVISPWCERIQISTMQAIAAYPGTREHLPQRGQDPWPAPKGEVESLVNVLRPLTSFTHENGAIRVWPSTHGATAPKEPVSASFVTVEMEPGSALLLLGSTPQSAGANHSAAVRRGQVVSYALDWIKPYENPWRAYPPKIARTFAPDLAALFGYRQHRSDRDNLDGRWPSVLLDDGIDPDFLLSAIEMLEPGQAARVAAHSTRPFLTS